VETRELEGRSRGNQGGEAIVSSAGARSEKSRGRVKRGGEDGREDKWVQGVASRGKAWAEM